MISFLNYYDIIFSRGWQMRIGIDIDDTIVDTSKRIEEYLIEHLDYSDKDDIHEQTKLVLLSDFQDSKSINFVKDHFRQIAESALVKEYALDVLNRLKERHEIYIITARSDDLTKAIDMTIDYLRDYNIPHDKLITGAFDKVEDCVYHEIDLMIDDKLSTIETIRNAGIKTLLFTSPLNENFETSSPRAKDWLEVEKYILELEKEL